ncbi:putative NTPase (NACHT family) [Cylindrospermum stagnale PCC 7417]|uniref:Putative NTPase (NACHT family) n=1 Tax=Cylindrospermum stagnale PCC 7417 TaxID=56107 RepID=K9WTZ5_9NOST|nr:NACHT domain-containing protein [Cylindrospermum stagnale]AFZ23007.1 putative NTPase (NACHT family) [Cylindrospermum stagnale PCC 7417]
MGKLTKGPGSKKLVWDFVETLFTRGDNLPGFKIHWEKENANRPELVVNTQRRVLNNLDSFTKNKIGTVIKLLEELEIWDDRRLNQKQGSDKGKFALKLWSLTDVETNRKEFEVLWEASRTNKSKDLEAIYQRSLNTAEETQGEFDWQNICRTMLEEQKKFTTKRLMLAEEMVFNINDIDVKLALVKRKPPDKRIGDDDSERFRFSQPEYEETEKLEYEEFFDKVLKSEQSNKIAIIGEPGAGKTTLLQKIAFEILEKNLGLPIWISLGNLATPTPNFQEYLLNDWLKNAIFPVTSKHKDEFTELITAGKVWLLLDGVDEIAVNSGNPLTVISDGFQAWSKDLHLVLSCRLNIWEANPFLLDGFETYRTLQFSQEKVDDFIKAGFQKNSALGDELQKALNQPGKERIKDLVKNPLRLMLLCSTWQGLNGKLPDTKAELYQQFVDEFYKWKKKEFDITSEKKKQLNAKLEELALKGTDNANNRFCLPEKFIEKILGEKDDDLFSLALKIGWLNQVGVDAKNPNQRVYAFYHPTFQEYFAALAIDDWDFFLPREHDNNNPQPVSDRYRIFEPQWKEVILLWLGRDNVNKDEKENFIKRMVEFKDGCEGFYLFSGIFMSAASLAEFRDFQDFNFPDRIIEYIVKLAFGYYDDKQYCCHRNLPILTQKAWSVIQDTDRSKAIEHITKLLSAHMDILKELFPVEEELIIPGYDGALLNFIEEVSLRLLILEKDNSDAIKNLNYLFQNFYFIDIDFPSWAGDVEDIKIMNKTLISYISSGHIKSCYSVNNFREEHIEIENSQSENSHSLEDILSGRSEIEVINDLIKQVYEGSDDSNQGTAAIFSLKKILKGNLFEVIVKMLKDFLIKPEFRSKHWLVRQCCWEIVRYSAENMTYPDFYQAWYQPAAIEMSKS